MARGTVQARLDRMERTGVITGWGPDISPEAIGYGVTAFVTIQIAQHSGRDMSAVAHFVDDRSPDDLMEHSVEQRAELLGRALIGIRPGCGRVNR